MTSHALRPTSHLHTERMTPQALADAQRMDREDPLAPFRRRFEFPRRPGGEPQLYFCGNSLGLMPRAARELVDRELEDWGRMAVAGHFRRQAPWFSYHETVRDALARIVGAGADEVVAMNSLTVNLHLMLATFYQPSAARRKILVDGPLFPSDLYAVRSHLALRTGDDPAGLLLQARPRSGEDTLREEDIEAELARSGREIALVLLAGVNYHTGQALDLGRLVTAAHRAGCRIGFDLAHAAGNIPLALHDWDADFAVWCSYKYLNAGPGAVAGCFVHRKHGRNRDLPRLAGWWGHDAETRFQMDRAREFVPQQGAEGWQLSNPPILALAPLRASLALFDEAGMAALRRKSEGSDRLPRVAARAAGRPRLRDHHAGRSRQARLPALPAAGRAGGSDPRRAGGAGHCGRLPAARRAPGGPGAALQLLRRCLGPGAGAAAADGRVSSEPFTVVGAGLGGALMALLLAQDGHRVTVYERRPDPRRAGADTGRSINLAISARGLHAMDQAGLTDQVRAMAVPMRGRMMHDEAGRLTFQAYGARGQAINSVSRGDLNLLLLEAAERAGARLVFEHRCLDLDFEAGTLDLLDSAGGREVRVEAPVVIGADGAFSAVRARMQRQDRFDYSQSYLEHGYKELSIPPAGGGGFRLEPHALHIWPRGGYMMIALPNRDGSFTCTLFWPFRGRNSFEAIRTPADLEAFFRRTYPDALPLMPALMEDFFANPTGSLVTVRCAPWQVDGRAVLLGDAAHAVVPFYGQGANASFEDCVILRDCLRAHPDDRARAFARFSRSRRPHADALADLAIDNFVEMRDRVAHPAFLLKKKGEHLLARLFPRWYLPLYTMVSFSRIPYADAVARARRQQRWVAAGLAVLAVAAALALWWWS